ncbi:MAG: cyclic nucleotide-binding domain-containing protein [Pseudomonas sp.]|uniref:cyclic nucleotide-binding domain-containing protein n=1 Tax=Pseudomonas sp. TaxID=306 RepID=UPI0033974E9C
MPESAHLVGAIRDMLMDCGLFDTLLPAEAQSAAGYFSISKMTQDTVIFREGDAGTFMCILHQGRISVRKSNSSEQLVEFATLRNGRAFGEMAVLDGERRSATCVAATDCVLLILAKDSLEKMLQEAPRPAAKVIRAIAVALSKRLRMADGQLVDQ